MKLSDVQQKLKVPKSQLNKFGGYKYRNCEDILEAVKPLLGESTVTISDEIVQIGDRFYVKATATFKDKDQLGAGTSVTAFARESLDKKGMDVAQITGAASSYARKYALNGLFLIDDTKDADNDENRITEPPKPAMKPYSMPRKVAAAEDEADGATIPPADREEEANRIIVDEEAVYTRNEIEDMQKDQIRDLLKVMKKPTTKQSILSLTDLEMKPENYTKIIALLSEKLEATDPLSEFAKE